MAVATRKNTAICVRGELTEVSIHGDPAAHVWLGSPGWSNEERFLARKLSIGIAIYSKYALIMALKAMDE